MAPRPKIDEATFISEFERIGPVEMARRYHLHLSAIFRRRISIENRIGRQLISPAPNPGGNRRVHTIAPMLRSRLGKLDLYVENGCVLVGSDAHYWPGVVSTAHRAFVAFCKELCPSIVVLNGDVFDGARVSRHASIGWEKRPTVISEIDACKERLGEIMAASTAAKHVWPIGNHDERFETRLAQVAPEYAKVHGVHLKDHFPEWDTCQILFLNGEVVIAHAFKGGIHATHNNALWSGKTMVTGHLHSLKVTPFPDYNGDRWGVDCGTLAEPYGPQFADYTRMNPVNWRSGFAVLTFVEGVLLQPELVRVVEEGVIDFRGALREV